MKASSRNLAIAFSLIIIALIFYYFSDIVTYILLAWVFSMIGQRLMHFYQARLKIGKFQAGAGFCAILTIVTYLLLFGALIWLFVPPIVEQARNLASVDYTAIAQTLEEPMRQINNQLHRLGILDPGEQSAEEQLKDAFKEWFEPSKLGDFFGSLIGFAGNFVMTIFSVVFIAFFFLKEQGLFVKLLVGAMPSQYETHVKQAVEEISRMLGRYFWGVLVQVTIITIAVSLTLKLLGIKNALLIGFFAALINVIPYLGPLIGASFGIFITISSNLELEFYTEMVPLLLKVVAVFGMMQLLDNMILQPYIFSNSVLAHPLEIFIIIMIGAQMGGVFGMILAIPVYTIIRVIARVFFSRYQIVRNLTDSMASGK